MKTNLSQKLWGKCGCLAGCMFVQLGERGGQWRQDLLHGVGKSKVCEKHRQDGDESHSCGIRRSVGVFQINLEALDQQGLEGGQIPQHLVFLFHPIRWSVRSFNENRGQSTVKATKFNAQNVKESCNSLTLKFLLKLSRVWRKVHTLYHYLQTTGDIVQCWRNLEEQTTSQFEEEPLPTSSRTAHSYLPIKPLCISQHSF